MLEQKWNKREACPKGSVEPFNIDAKLNGAYIALGLLYGGGDLGETMVIAMRAGQDLDCNPASAAEILGVMHGYEAIPDQWESSIPGLADKKFAFTDYTFDSIVESTERRAIELMERNRRRLDGDRLLVQTQEPVAAELESWDDYGSPVEEILVADDGWSFSGDWETVERRLRAWAYVEQKSARKGTEATVSFSGTGAILFGPLMMTGGVADVYLDGELHRTVDVYSDGVGCRNSEAVWHAFGLADEEHTLRVVVRGGGAGSRRRA